MGEYSPHAASFPVYRQLADGRHFYRIEGPTRFTEIQRMGGRLVVHLVEAQAYPELVRIEQMIQATDGHFLPLDPAEWEVLYARI